MMPRGNSLRSCQSALASALIAMHAKAASDHPDSKNREPGAAPAAYSLPWALRPVVSASAIRVETSLARYENAAADHGVTAATVLTGSYRVEGTGPKGAGLTPLFRMAMVADAPPVGIPGGFVVGNPLLGASYAALFSNMRANVLLGATLPVGGGGGDAPDAGTVNARQKGVPARVQMDNALFAVNDLAIVFGLGGAYVAHGLTIQIEATLLHLVRVRGEAVQKETSKTNFTTGLHVGYFVMGHLSVGAEARYQRWINAPLSVDADASGATKDTLSLAVGPRGHIKLGRAWFRPSIAYERGLDKPLASAQLNYHIVRVDLPIVF